MAISLEKMSRKELLELRDQVEAALKSAEKRERKEALKAAEKAAAEFGFSLSELSEGAVKPAKASKTKAKYKNPANAGTNLVRPRTQTAMGSRCLECRR